MSCAPAPHPVDRAIAWMSNWRGEPDFDALVVTHAIAQRRPSPGANALRDRMAAAVDPDGGHPLRRLVDPAFRVPAGKVQSWQVTGRVPFERVLAEAAHCADHGLRPSTAAWICGGMRDGGGYGSTHALWAIAIAAQSGCAPPICGQEVAAELVAAQPVSPGPGLGDVDLFAERVLMRMLADVAVPPAEIDALRAAQREDGSFGDPSTDPRPVAALHATMVAAWALSEADLPGKVGP